MSDKPAFEVISTDPAMPWKFRVWEDGRIEGFPENAIIINRIPSLINDAVSHVKEAFYNGHRAKTT